jgi:hypothetical protein
MSVLPPDATVAWKRRWWRLLLVLSILVLLGAYLVWDKFFHESPQEFTSIEERFKHGSIGAEDESGIPYWIWVVLPRVFPEYLPGPGGYTSLGIAWEPGAEMPVGFSKKRIGYDRVAINCALCHSGTYRTQTKDGTLGVTQLVLGAPATRLDSQSYLNFLAQCANDPRFNAGTLMGAIAYEVNLSWIDQALYRYLLIPGTRKALQKQAAAGRWMTDRPAWGPGRIDPFNPVKFGMLEMPVDGTIGNSDMMPLWRLSQRKTNSGAGNFNMHWDGLNTSPFDTCLAGALGDGATRKSLPVSEIRSLFEWFSTLQPPPRPDIERAAPPATALLSQGRQLFQKHCAECHSKQGARTNTVIPIAELPAPQQTDDNRLRMWNTVKLADPNNPTDTRHPAARYNHFGDGYSWDLKTFVGTSGYVSVPLDGLWLRAPYLHNGSVPTLEDLLNPPLDTRELDSLLADAAKEVGLTQRLAELGSLLSQGKDRFDEQHAEEWIQSLIQALVRQSQVAPLSGRLAQSFGRAQSDLPLSQLSAELRKLEPLVDCVVKQSRMKNRRPPMFYRGSDLLDPQFVGFVHTSEAAQGRRLAIPYLTFISGNDNQGHLYGTDLSEGDKRALVEYLKRSPDGESN